jgi:hypothetical protein
LIKRRPQFGRTVAMHHPVFFAEFRATASALGFNRHSTEAQWAALCQVCAVHAVPPEALTQDQVDAAPEALCAAGRRLGRPMRSLRSALFHLEATLFHAEVTDELPRRRNPDMTSEPVEFLARTGLRKGEYLGLTVDAVVQIGSCVLAAGPDRQASQ